MTSRKHCSGLVGKLGMKNQGSGFPVPVPTTRRNPTKWSPCPQLLHKFTLDSKLKSTLGSTLSSTQTWIHTFLILNSNSHSSSWGHWGLGTILPGHEPSNPNFQFSHHFVIATTDHPNSRNIKTGILLFGWCFSYSKQIKFSDIEIDSEKLGKFINRKKPKLSGEAIN